MNFDQFKFNTQFQITLNSELLYSENDIKIFETILNDKKQFDLADDNLILSLKGLQNLPINVDPKVYTFVVQKMNVITTYIKNIKKYQYSIQSDVVEYNSSFKPNDNYQLIKETKNKIKYEVNLYQVISNRANSIDNILNIVSENLDVKKNKIIKHNGLIYYIQPESLLDQSEQLNQKIKKYCSDRIPKLLNLD